MKKWIKEKLWPFLKKWGGKILLVIAALFLIDKTKDFIYDSFLGLVPHGSRYFKTIPGNKKKILVKKEGEFVYVDLSKLAGDVTSDKVKAAAYDPDSKKFIIEVKHEIPDISGPVIDNNAYDALHGSGDNRP